MSMLEAAGIYPGDIEQAEDSISRKLEIVLDDDEMDDWEKEFSARWSEKFDAEDPTNSLIQAMVDAGKRVLFSVYDNSLHICSEEINAGASSIELENEDSIELVSNRYGVPLHMLQDMIRDGWFKRFDRNELDILTSGEPFRSIREYYRDHHSLPDIEKAAAELSEYEPDEDEERD